MGTDGKYYFIDALDNPENDEKKYKSGAEVFTRYQGALTHAQCNHSELLGGGMLGQQGMKKVTSRNIKFRRPQSAQVKTNKQKPKVMRAHKHNHSKDSLHQRPQTSQKKR